jgi:hypothetical protein
VGVEIAQEQGALKEHQCGIPNGGGTAKGGQDHFCDQRLNQKQQKRADENGEGEEESHR